MTNQQLTTHPEDQRRFSIAIVVSVLIIVAYQHLFLTPEPRVVAPLQAPQQTVVPGGPIPSTSTADSPVTSPVGTSAVGTSSVPQQTSATTATLPNHDRHPLPQELDEAGYISFSSNTFTGTIAKLGGRISSLQLHQHRASAHSAEKLDMVESKPGGTLPLGLYVGSGNDSFVRYELVGVPPRDEHGNITPDPSGELQVQLKGTLPGGEEILKGIRLHPDSYLIDVTATVTGLSGPTWLEWSDTLAASKKNDRLDPPHFTKLTAEGSLEHLQLSELAGTKPIVKDVGINQWLAFGRKYFLAALLPATENSTFVAGYDQVDTFVIRTPIDSKNGKVTLYVGPKSEEVLASAGRSLQRAIDLGVFTVIAHPLLSILRFFYSILNNYGLAIILLTICVKLALYWLSKKSFDSMAKMQEIQPEIQKLRSRVEDPTALNQEIMALYKAKGVNPLGGCLPMLAQIPVFFALYSALGNSIELRHAPFALWIDDLSAPERLMLFGIPIPVMILIMGATFVWQQKSQPTTIQDPTQKRIMMMMPVMFTFMMIIFPIPAGLVIYMLVNNILSITQQIYLRNVHGTHPLLATTVASVCLFMFGYVLTLIS